MSSGWIVLARHAFSYNSKSKNFLYKIGSIYSFKSKNVFGESPSFESTVIDLSIMFLAQCKHQPIIIEKVKTLKRYAQDTLFHLDEFW